MLRQHLDKIDKEEADRQFNEVKTQGVVYTIAVSALKIKQFDDQGKEIKSEIKESDAKEITVRESLFNFARYLEILKTYVDNYEKWSYEKCKSYWCQVVGWAQRTLPACIAQEYCQPNRPFDPVPNFSQSNFVRSTDYYNWVMRGDASWFPLEVSTLGSDFGILRGDWLQAGARGRGREASPELAQIDLAALTALNNVLLQKFAGLKQQPAAEKAKEMKSSLNP